jgi:hypothetical protein
VAESAWNAWPNDVEYALLNVETIRLAAVRMLPQALDDIYGMPIAPK